LAHFRKLPNEILHRIAGKISDHVGRGVPAHQWRSDIDRLELAEHFEVWVLERHIARSKEERMASMARRTGRWHHQIRSAGGINHYARSAAYGPDPSDWLITNLFESALAPKIDETIRWLDTAELTGDPQVRLLVVPYYLLDVFWLESESNDSFVLISKPDAVINMEREHLYPLDDFLGILAAQAHSRRLRP
jgi:hypothetical protein